MNKNLNIYNNKETIDNYSKLKYILEPEKVILEHAKKMDFKNTMLDIGVGTGRTTDLFTDVFKNYIGIDYAQEMITYCDNKYKESKNTTFNEADARDLKFIESDSIDFTLFSFNGIDCVNYQDRIIILKEIKRVGKKDSLFAFSTHNFYNIPKLFKIQVPKNPFNWIKEYKRLKGVRAHNNFKEIFSEENYAQVIDGDKNNFDYQYVYIKPKFQIETLENMGFTDIKAFDLSGNNLSLNKIDWEKFNEPWIHFICKITK